MSEVLSLLLGRRAIKSFDPVEVSEEVRDQVLRAACHAPSSFNMQPYRFYWVQSSGKRADLAGLCLSQKPAVTASVLIVAVADLSAFSSTSQAQVEWMRKSNVSEEKIRSYERDARIGRVLFMPGPFNSFAALKRILFFVLNWWKGIGTPPLSRQSLFKWATKSTALACQNLMIAAEALGMNTCPMEGFDGRRLSRYLRLRGRHQEIVMVIALGKKAHNFSAPPQWRRPLETTVTVL